MRSVDEVRERLSKVEGSMPEFVLWSLSLAEYIFGGVLAESILAESILAERGEH